MGTVLSKVFGNSSKKNGAAELGAGQSATLPRATTSKVKIEGPKKSSSFKLPFPGRKSKTPSPAVTPKITPKNEENVVSVAAPAPAPLNVIDVQIDEEAFKKTAVAQVEKVQEKLETLNEEVQNEAENEADRAENAIVKIQANVRGFLTRKHIKESGSPEKEIIEVPSISIEKRIETPTPSSPIAKTTFTSIEPSVQSEERPEVSFEELEILKKVQEINQLLANDDDDKPFLETVKTKVDQTAETVVNTVENVLSSFNETVEEKVETPVENAPEPVVEENIEAVVIESAFAEPITEAKLSSEIESAPQVELKEVQEELIQQQQAVSTTSTQQVPIHLFKSPSIEQEDEEHSVDGVDISGSLSQETSVVSEIECDERKGLTAENAAIRIQAAYRGYECRKSLSREPSPSRDRVVEETEEMPKSEELETISSLIPEPSNDQIEVIENIIVPVAVETKNDVDNVDANEIPEEIENKSTPVEEAVIVPVCLSQEQQQNSTPAQIVSDVEETSELVNSEKSTDLPVEEPVLEPIIEETIIPEPKFEQEAVESVPESIFEKFSVSEPEIKDKRKIEESVPESIVEESSTLESKIEEEKEIEESVPGAIVEESSIPEPETEIEKEIIETVFEPIVEETKIAEPEQENEQQVDETVLKVEPVQEEPITEVKLQETCDDEKAIDEILQDFVPEDEKAIEEILKEFSSEQESVPQDQVTTAVDQTVETENIQENIDQENIEESIKSEEINQEKPAKPAEENIENVAPTVESTPEKEKSLSTPPTVDASLDSVIEASLEENKDSLVMKIKIGVENPDVNATNDDDNDEKEDTSEEDLSASMPLRDSSPAPAGNKKRNRNRNKNRKR